MQLQPVILSGGSGTRLWPLSRELYPKQLLPLLGDNTMLQETVLRLAGLEQDMDVLSPVIVCNEEHRFMVAEQLRQIDVTPSAIMLEPAGRNTAPALTLAALHVSRQQADTVLLVLPADHVIQDTAAFHRAVQEGFELAGQDDFITFGIVPTAAETGFGYIHKGTAISNNTFLLDAFVEKPDQQTAENYIATGEYLWNSGMFMMKASRWCQAIEKFAPDIFDKCRNAVNNGSTDYDFFRANADDFLASPDNSIDYAVMEHLGQPARDDFKACVIALDAGWSDVGAWPALWELQDKDEQGNVTHGDVFLQDSSNSLVMSNQRLIAVIGINDSIIVETADAIVVAAMDRAQDIKDVVQWLKSQNRDEHILHQRVYRPWGHYEGVDVGQNFQVKRITVNPGASLSLQRHQHRAEHWVVVQGTAHVTRDDELIELHENESTYIPIGCKHRLENRHDTPLEIIEIQSGEYLGEDDIERFDDKYGR